MSVFKNGMKQYLDETGEFIRQLYLRDDIPWVIGYSGGKDSTAVLQLIWYSLMRLPHEQRTKKVFTITTDTMVENPVVTAWVSRSVEKINEMAAKAKLPIVGCELKPEIENTFWVNLIGRGYPSPRQGFRWCTDRLKIKPSTKFIMDKIQHYGEVILLLGTRKAESSTRKRSMEKYKEMSNHELFSVNGDLKNSYIWTPIEDWDTPDVWEFLMSMPNPWGWDNKQLMSMYRGATEDNECPLVVDRSTQSCGDSRFGCWVCTMVSQDKSMEAMINNDSEKEWMAPLLEVRDALDNQDDDHLRDYKRGDGTLHIFNGESTRGPYHQNARSMWLRMVLEAQKEIQENAPDHLSDIEIITIDELRQIRLLWVKHHREIEDRLPKIYKEVFGKDIRWPFLGEAGGLKAEDFQILKEMCGNNDLHYRLVRNLLGMSAEHKYKRRGVYDALEKCISENFFDNEEDAKEWILDKAKKAEVLGTGFEGDMLDKKSKINSLRDIADSVS